MSRSDDLKRDGMIDMIKALDAALGVRIQKWVDEANDVPRVVLSPRQQKRNKSHVFECKIRIDEIQEIRKLLSGAVDVAEGQNAETPPDAEVIQ